ncbi:MAG: hypothetical protein E7Z92_07280 [Cyanobacteria bacterium SIG31]|nr:hypothetical protein [Cyanobacteria bacterium SIG31]
MRKLLAIIILLNITLPSQAWFWDKKDKALEAELQGKGYAGTLPDLKKNHQKKEQKVSTPIFESQKGFDDPSDLKPVPRDNPAFIDIITKKDKTSKYVVDINELIPIIEKLADCIEEEGNVQLFVTRANVLSMNLDHLQRKYDGQPESYYESFKKLMEINGYVKSLSQLRKEAITYQRYLAYQSTGSVYNPENINQQLQYLLDELNTAVVMLKQEE